MIAVRRVTEGVVMIELRLLPVSKPQTGEYRIGAGSHPERTTHCNRTSGADIRLGSSATEEIEARRSLRPLHPESGQIVVVSGCPLCNKIGNSHCNKMR